MAAWPIDEPVEYARLCLLVLGYAVARMAWLYGPPGDVVNGALRPEAPDATTWRTRTLAASAAMAASQLHFLAWPGMVLLPLLALLPWATSSALRAWGRNRGDGLSADDPGPVIALYGIEAAVLVGCWWLMALPWNAPLNLVPPLDAGTAPTWAAASLVAAAYVFVTFDGSRIVRATLHARVNDAARNAARQEHKEERERALRAGRLVGFLERLLMLTLVLVGQWTALGLVIAVKGLRPQQTAAELPFPEYYLAGTLASVLVAVGLGLGVGALL